MSIDATSHFVLIHPDDNILVCCKPAQAGDRVIIDGAEFSLSEAIPLGHKIARRTLAEGEKVLRYGLPIGSMSQTAMPGEHVHRHNLSSDYIASHHRDAAQIDEIRS